MKKPPMEMKSLPRGLWKAAMKTAAEVFPRHNPYGVVGFGVSSKRTRGRLLDYSTLVVYVSRKLQQPEAPVPPVPLTWKGKRYTVLPDVVATGARPSATLGSSWTFSGLHPGAGIAVATQILSMGGVAALLGRGTLPTHLVTAGHLFAPGSEAAPVFAALSPLHPRVVIGRLVRNLLDEPRQDGSPHEIDAALVELTEEGRVMAALSTRGPTLHRITAWGDTLGKSAQAFLPNAHDYSNPVGVADEPSTWFVDAPGRGRYEVSNVLQTAAITSEGDSGTCLLTQEEERGVMGIGVGAVGSAFSLFEPFPRALKYLARSTEFPLPLWSPTGGNS